MGNLKATDDAILTVKESLRRDNLVLEDRRCTTEQALAIRQNKARCETLLRELWRHRLRLVGREHGARAELGVLHAISSAPKLTR